MSRQESKLKPAFVLCGANRTGRQCSRHHSLPTYGPIVVKEWNPDPQAPGGFRGLPWGVGDPVAAFLDDPEWAVIRIDDPDGPIPIPSVEGSGTSIAAVKFQTGTVFYWGDRRGAVETLIQHGAEPQRMSVRLALPGENGVADVGAYGVAVAGTSGMARGGERSHVFVDSGYGGIAVSGHHGRAQALCFHGIAIVGEYGEANAGEEGLAASCDFGVRLSAGRGGVAIAIQSAGRIKVGVSGAAVALRGVERFEGASNSITVVRNAVPGRTRFRLAAGAMAVFCFSEQRGARFAVAHAGRGGIDPDTIHVWAEGEFRKVERWSSDTETGEIDLSPETMPSDEVDAPDYWREVNSCLDMDGPLGNDSIVLCGAEERQWPGDVIHAEEWSPAPDSSNGLRGLAWGLGTPEVGARYGGRYEWLLVRVSNPVPVPTPETPSARLVRFAEGRVIFRGDPKAALDILTRFGQAPESLVAQIVSAPPGKIARTSGFGVAAAGRGGWAISAYYAEAGPEGLARGHWAVAGDRGFAIDEWKAKAGRNGIAIADSKRHGFAEAGEGGAAVNLGERFGAAEGTVAIFLGLAGIVRAGDGGVAIGGHGADVRTGRNGVAVVRGACPTGGPGALLVCCDKDEIRTAIVGEDGAAPAEFVEWAQSRTKEVA